MDRGLLAETLKTLRRERKVSLAQVSRATGISTSFLSLLEQGGSDVTISRLVALAEFYDVEMTDLLAGGKSLPARNHRLLQMLPEHLSRFREEGVDHYDLTAGVRWTMLASVSVYEPGGSVLIADVHEREALFFILKGRFEIAFENEDPIVLKKEEGISLKSTRPYTIRNVTGKEARILSIGMHPQPD